MFSLGRLATGLISSSGETAPVDAPSGSARSEADGDDDPPSSSRSRPSAACPASPILRRSKELGSSSSSSSNSSSSPGGPCLAAVGGGSLGNLPRSLPPSASAVGLKGLPLQLISTALSVGPTLLPPHLANLISALALSMRVSLRATAFFVEAILESCKYGTAAGLGLTRRALIAAVSSARTVYAVREGMDWAGDKLGSLKGNDAFLSVLDRYTNLGIYLITHTFTLAELFAMSGFYLTLTAVQTGISAAQESVSLFDGIFGSNESSRALSSIITLIRTEVMHDKRLAERKMGTVRSLTALTKALTAFACLQVATRKRFSNAKQPKVLFDCTVVGQLNEDSSGRIDVDNQPSSASTGPSSEEPTSHPAWDGGPRSPSYARDDSGYLLTDVRSALQHQQHQQQQSPSADDAGEADVGLDARSPGSNDDEALVRQLEHLVGEDPEEFVEESEGSRFQQRWRGGEQEDYYEITEQVTEQVTETQTVEHYEAADFHRLRQPDGSRLKAPPAAPALAEDDEWIEVENGLVPAPSDGDDDDSEDRSATTRVRLVAIPSSPNGHGSAFAPTRTTTTVASRAYDEALDNPQESSARVQVILKTITRRLLQKKRTVKRVRGHSPGSPPLVPRNTLRHGGRSEAVASLMDVDWQATRLPEDSASTEELKEVEDLVGSSASESAAAVTPSAIFGPTGEQLYPDLAAEEPMGSASLSSSSVPPSPISQPSLALSPAVTPRKTKRQLSSSSTSSSSAPTPSIGALSRALVRAKAGFQPRAAPRAEAYASEDLPTIDVAMPRRSPSREPGHPSARLATGNGRKQPSLPFPPKASSKHHARPPPVASSSTSASARRHRHESVTSTRTTESHSQYHSSAKAPPSDEASPAALFPADHLVKNIHKFCRFSSAAYGQNFLRVLGLGSTDFMFPSGGRYHPNTWAFAQHTNLPIECMLLSSYVDPGPALSNEKLNPLVHYIAVDHAAKAVVLTCRGTLGLSDVLVDLCCEYEELEVEGGDPGQTYLAHSGMLFSARKLMNSSSTIHETIRKALEDWPTYGLVLTGHSLGGGAAALLSILWSCPTTYFDEHAASLPGIQQSTVGQRTPFVTNFSSGLPAGRPIHCYTYGCPSVASVDLASHTKGLISSVVQNNDIVPTLSLGVLRDFKNIAVTLSDESSVTEEIVGRVVGLHQRRLRIKYGPALLQPAPAGEPDGPLPEVHLNAEELQRGHSRNYARDRHYRDPARETSPEIDVPSEQQQLDDWLFSLYKTLRADMDSEKLYPPGTVYNMEHWEVYLIGSPDGSPNGSPRPDGGRKTSQKEAHRVVLRAVDDVPRRFGELTFSKSMLNDHLPTNYEKSTALLYQGLFGP